MSDTLTGFIRFLMEAESWQEDAECRRRGMSPSDFVLERGQSSKPAKEACAACPVSAECEDYAHRTGSVGIWGGRIQKAMPLPPIRVFTQDARPTAVITDDLPEWPDDPVVVPIVFMGDIQDSRPQLVAV